MTRLFSIVRARHETLNKGMKQVRVLNDWFRHSIALHSFCFDAVANITQAIIQGGEPLFTF